MWTESDNKPCSVLSLVANEAAVPNYVHGTNVIFPIIVKYLHLATTSVITTSRTASERQACAAIHAARHSRPPVDKNEAFLIHTHHT